MLGAELEFYMTVDRDKVGTEDTFRCEIVVSNAPEGAVVQFPTPQDFEVLSRSELSEHIYAQDSDRDSNTIEVFVGRLRRKLPAACIETVRGMGYVLEAPEEP